MQSIGEDHLKVKQRALSVEKKRKSYRFTLKAHEIYELVSDLCGYPCVCLCPHVLMVQFGRFQHQWR